MSCICRSISSIVERFIRLVPPEGVTLAEGEDFDYLCGDKTKFNLNLRKMKNQFIFTRCFRINSTGNYNFNLDADTMAINQDGYEVKQVTTTSFIDGGRPVLAVTFLVEREADGDSQG